MSDEPEDPEADLSEKLDKMMSALPDTCVIAHAESIPDQNDDRVPEMAVVVMAVSERGWGFAEMTFVQDARGQLFLDTENTGLRRIARMLWRWLKTAITDRDRDPERHRRFNEAMRITDCSCSICQGKGKS